MDDFAKPISERKVIKTTEELAKRDISQKNANADIFNATRPEKIGMIPPPLEV